MPDFLKYFLLDLSVKEATELYHWLADNRRGGYPADAQMFDKLDVVIRSSTEVAK